MTTSDFLDNKLKEFYDHETLKKKSPEELIKIIDSLNIGGEITTKAFMDCCNDFIRNLKITADLIKFHPFLEMVVDPDILEKLSQLSPDEMFSGYMAAAINENLEINEDELSEFIKKCRNDSSVSDEQLVAGLKNIMGMEEQK